MNIEDKKFADSEKNEPEEYFTHPDLNEKTNQIFHILSVEEARRGPVNPQLAELLHEIQTRQLYIGEKDENGRTLFTSFEKYIKTLRRLWVRKAGGSKGNRYKQVTEAILENRLKAAGVERLPESRGVLQKLSTLRPELQVTAWQEVVKRAAGGKITPTLVAITAHALGDHDVTIPTPTASSQRPKLQVAWAAFKDHVTKAFGVGIIPYFQPIDLLLPKPRHEKKPEPSHEHPMETSASTTTQAAAKSNEKADAPPELGAPGKSAGPGATFSPMEVDPEVTVQLKHQYKQPDLGDSVAGLSQLPRPFVTSQGGYIYIALKGKEHLTALMAAGFKHPLAWGFAWQGDQLAWQRRITLPPDKLEEEIHEIAGNLQQASLRLIISGHAV